MVICHLEFCGQFWQGERQLMIQCILQLLECKSLVFFSNLSCTLVLLLSLPPLLLSKLWCIDRTISLPTMTHKKLLKKKVFSFLCLSLSMGFVTYFLEIVCK